MGLVSCGDSLRVGHTLDMPKSSQFYLLQYAVLSCASVMRDCRVSSSSSSAISAGLTTRTPFTKVLGSVLTNS